MAKRTKKTGMARGRVPPRRVCGAMAAHMMLLEKYPAFRMNLMKLEGATAKQRQAPVDLAQMPIVTVDTVVHVVYATDAENVGDDQIASQLDVLNRDFRATNTDRSKVPAPWAGLVTDARISFRLVEVTRTPTTVRGFGTDDGVKNAATGGIAPIDTRSRLNLWVCALRDGVLGYAQFPGGPPATDGVVINFSAFGTVGTAQAPFNLGRTASHEVGHYLNLRHIWGDTPDCSGGDGVADTPNCEGPNFGTPVWPSVTCNNGPAGDMFVNYMDYVDDRAMFMFTSQQVLRMRTALETARPGLMATAAAARRKR
ncbi:MAG: zinc metalloprotease [Planctomycetota bacterium]